MSDKTNDTGTIQVLLERLLRFRLPRTLEIKQRIDSGERLSDTELEFLKDALNDAKDAEKFVARNPEFHALGGRIAQLYGDIINKALENEKGTR